jgi:hypothetical protein
MFGASLRLYSAGHGWSRLMARGYNCQGSPAKVEPTSASICWRYSVGLTLQAAHSNAVDGVSAAPVPVLTALGLRRDAHAALIAKRGLSGPRCAPGGSHAPDEGKLEPQNRNTADCAKEPFLGSALRPDPKPSKANGRSHRSSPNPF